MSGSRICLNLRLRRGYRETVGDELMVLSTIPVRDFAFDIRPEALVQGKPGPVRVHTKHPDGKRPWPRPGTSGDG